MHIDRKRAAELGREADAMAERIAKVLTIAALHDHDTLILGAWGCGAFGNDCGEIEGLFRDALRSTFRDVFDTIMLP